jgi:hypothetical protein
MDENRSSGSVANPRRITASTRASRPSRPVDERTTSGSSEGLMPWIAS